jgi:transcriptional regulator with XRE-family HTH domain
MLTPTITDGLNKYQIGPKLRSLRLKKGIGLVELGQHSGLSSAMISKIERGRIFPTLPTLLRLALVFSVGLEYFFGESEPRPMFVRISKSERLRFPNKANARPGEVSYTFESLDFEAVQRKLSAYLAHFEPVDGEPAKGRFHVHEGVEFIYVIEGDLEIFVAEGDVHRLNAGDSAYFDATAAHAYARVGSNPCSAIVVTVP